MSKHLIKIKDNSPQIGNKRGHDSGFNFERKNVRTKRANEYQKWGKRNNKCFRQL